MLTESESYKFKRNLVTRTELNLVESWSLNSNWIAFVLVSVSPKHNSAWLPPLKSLGFRCWNNYQWFHPFDRIVRTCFYESRIYNIFDSRYSHWRLSNICCQYHLQSAMIKNTEWSHRNQIRVYGTDKILNPLMCSIEIESSRNTVLHVNYLYPFTVHLFPCVCVEMNYNGYIKNNYVYQLT